MSEKSQARQIRWPAGSRRPLVDSILRYIERRSFGRVHRLQVDWHENRLVIHGRTTTYHAKQLVQHAAQEVANGAEIENRIEVVGR